MTDRDAKAAAWAAAKAAAEAATSEIMGAPSLSVFFFLPMFGFKDAAAIDAIQEAPYAAARKPAAEGEGKG